MFKSSYYLYTEHSHISLSSRDTERSTGRVPLSVKFLNRISFLLAACARAMLAEHVSEISRDEDSLAQLSAAS